MWPFTRNPAKPDADPGRQELPESQLQQTMQYGWQDTESADAKEVLRDSLQRHEDDLSEIAERRVD